LYCSLLGTQLRVRTSYHRGNIIRIIMKLRIIMFHANYAISRLHCAFSESRNCMHSAQS